MDLGLKMNATVFFIVSCLFVNACFAERYIKSTKYDYQNEILDKGVSIISSQKNNLVMMCQISETIADRKADFSFGISNFSDKPINFYVSNLRISDQLGRSIKCIRKKELIAENESSRSWRQFGAALCVGLQAANAQSAGDINYQSQTYGNYNSNINVIGSNEWANGSVYGSGSSTTSGTIHVEALRQQAQRQVAYDAAVIGNNINAKHDAVLFQLNNNYFDSTTIFPGTSYTADFRIEIPKNIAKELQYVMFTYDLGEERHTFCFYCGRVKKKWYHWG